MKRFILNPKVLWYSLIVGFSIFLFSLWEINNVIKRLKDEEIKQVEIWAKAVSRKADMVKETKEFYDKTLEVEQIKLQRFVEAYKIILSQDENADLTSSNLQFYTKIIMDNKTIPVIITDEFNNIQFYQNVVPEPQEKVLVGDLYKRFSHNKPLEYEVYGMKFKLYYTESNVFSNLRKVTDEVMYSFLSDVTNNGVSVPVIITDSAKRKVFACGNIDSSLLKADKIEATINNMLDDNTPIRISLPGKQYGYILYQKNKTISLLRYFPLVYIFFFILFGSLIYLVLRTIRSSEQNHLWVGMSKETAHQLGTPISSLTAWIELLRATPENVSTCEEMDKDIQRLSIITQRFSQIGSRPTLKPQNIIPIINNMVNYFSLRSPKKVVYINTVENYNEVVVPVNQFLIEWTLENLFKNAIDAMEGNGNIVISMEENEKRVFIDVSDTGKGMSKSMFKKIFHPGFTTKKRGWGLGLSLVKRIVEEYHRGKIYVKNSTINVGTTIRLELNK